MKFCDTLSDIYRNDPDGLRVFQVYHLLDLSNVMDESVREKHQLTSRRNSCLAVKIFSEAMDQGLLVRANPIQVVNMLWASFLGIVQVQGFYLRATQKDYVLETLRFCFSSLSKVLETRPRTGRRRSENKRGRNVVGPNGIQKGSLLRHGGGSCRSRERNGPAR